MPGFVAPNICWPIVRRTWKQDAQFIAWLTGTRNTSKFGAVLNNNPSPGNVAGGLLNITIKSGAIAKAGTTRVEASLNTLKHQPAVNLMQGPGYDQESTPV